MRGGIGTVTLFRAAVVLAMVAVTGATARPLRPSPNRPLPAPGGQSIRTWVILDATADRIVVSTTPACSTQPDRMEVRRVDGSVVARWRPTDLDFVWCVECNPVVVARGTERFAVSGDVVASRRRDRTVWQEEGDHNLGSLMSVRFDRTSAVVWAGSPQGTNGSTFPYEPQAEYPPGTPALDSIAQQAGGAVLSVAGDPDPRRSRIVHFGERRPGVARLIHREVVSTDPSSSWEGCYGTGGARAAVADEADRGPSILFFPTGLGGRVVALGRRDTSTGYTACRADPGGVTLWWQSVHGDDRVQVTRVTPSGVPWTKTLTLENSLSIVTRVDVGSGDLVAMPQFGAIQVIDPVTGAVHASRSVAVEDSAETSDGLWWLLDFNGATKVIPDPAGVR